MDWKPASDRSSPFSPISPSLSPTLLNLPSKLRNRIPTQLRRVIPAYLVGVILFILVFRVQVFPVPQPQPAVSKRQEPQKHLGGPDQATQPADFPKKIWQSWKSDPLNFDKRDFDTARTWTSKNPGYRYEVLTDFNDLVYVDEKFGPKGINRPDIIEFYRSVTATIIKADLLRYMIMYAEGGVYADIDVEALKPIDRFIPARYNLAEIDMVVGVEIDQPDFRDHPILGQKSMSFCQWTFMCRPRLPVMLQLIENIMAWLTDIAAKQKVPIPDVVLDFDAVISGTGPSAFTAAILNDMNKRTGTFGEKITWDAFHAIDESKLVRGVLVLDVEKFAAGQGHSDSGNHNARGALVKHHYHASNWPSKHPRFKHPVYGEVEQCNCKSRPINLPTPTPLNKTPILTQLAPKREPPLHPKMGRRRSSLRSPQPRRASQPPPAPRSRIPRRPAARPPPAIRRPGCCCRCYQAKARRRGAGQGHGAGDADAGCATAGGGGEGEGCRGCCCWGEWWSRRGWSFGSRSGSGSSSGSGSAGPISSGFAGFTCTAAAWWVPATASATSSWAGATSGVAAAGGDSAVGIDVMVGFGAGVWRCRALHVARSDLLKDLAWLIG